MVNKNRAALYKTYVSGRSRVNKYIYIYIYRNIKSFLEARNAENWDEVLHHDSVFSLWWIFVLKYFFSKYCVVRKQLFVGPFCVFFLNLSPKNYFLLSNNKSNWNMFIKHFYVFRCPAVIVAGPESKNYFAFTRMKSKH